MLALAVIAQLLAAFATAARFVWLALLCQASAPFWTDDLQAEVGPPACLDSPSRTALTGPDADLAFSHCPTPPPTNGFIKRQITDHFALPSPALLSGDPTWAKVAAALFVLLIGVLDLCWRIVLLSDLERAAPVMRASSAFQLVALLACSVVLVYVMWRAGRAHKAQSEPLGPFERPAVSSLDPALTTSAGRFPAAIGLALVGNVFGIAVTCADEAILGFSEAPAGRLLWAFQMMFYLSAALAICFIGRDTSMREPGPWATSSNVAGDRTAVRIYPSARSTLSTARWSEKQPESHGQSGRSISTDELREWCAPTREQEMRRVFSTVGERMKHGLRHFALGRRSRGRVEVAPAPERARAQDTPRVLPPLPRPSASSVFAELVEEYGHGPARPWVDVPSNVSMRSSQAAEGGHSPPATPLSHTSGVVMEAISAKPAAPRFLMFVQPYRNAASFDVQHSSIKDVKFDADLECMETSAKRTLRPHSIAVSHPRQERPKTNHILDFRCPPAAAASHKPRSRSDANAVPATTQMAALAPTTDEAVDLSIDVARQDRQERQDTLALTLDNRATVPRLRVPSPLRVTTSYSDEEGDQEMKHVVDDDASEIHSDEIVEIGRGRRFRGADANEYRESYGSHVTVTR